MRARSFAQLHDRTTHHALHFHDFWQCDAVMTARSSACDNAEESIDLKLRFVETIVSHGEDCLIRRRGCGYCSMRSDISRALLALVSGGLIYVKAY